MRSRSLGVLVVVVCVLAGMFLPALFVSKNAEASRNSSGTYSLPSGNPVVTGTSITSTWANTTLSDLKTEMTDSLSRSAKGAMLAKLQLYAGTSAAPGLTFDNDTDTGLYRNGSNDIRFGVDATYVQKWTSTDVAFPVGLTATQTASNTTALTATGNGTAAGITGVGGSTSGKGGNFTGGAPNGDAINGQGTGTGRGGVFTGGDSGGKGVVGTGGAGGNGIGGDFTGSGTAQGVKATGGASDGTGITATGGATNGVGGVFTGTGTGNAIQAGAGHIKLTGSNPASTTGYTNTLTPKNIIKAWAYVSVASGTPTLGNGFNITSVAYSGSPATLNVTFEDDMANSNYAAIGQTNLSTVWTRPSVFNAGNVVFLCFNSAGTQVDCNNLTFTVMVVGQQ